MKQTRRSLDGPKLWGLAACIFLLEAESATGRTLNDVWLGGTGSWNTEASWSNGIPNNNVPVGTSYNVFIDKGNAALSTVILNTNASISNLSISSGDQLFVNDGSSLTIVGSRIINAGTLSLNSTADNTDLVINAPNVTLSGAGNLTLSNNPNNRIYGSTAGDVLTNQGKIEGAGQIGIGQLTLVNSGTIDANQTNSIVISTGANFTNTGLVESTNTGGLVLEATTVTNAGGTLSGSGSGAVYLENGTTINGGTLKGKIFVTDRATFGSPVNNSSGVVSILDAAALTLGNGNYSQFGNVQLNSTGDSTSLIIAGTNVTLGGGTLTLSNNANNIITGTSASNTLTNQGIIRGAGQLGDGQLTLVNSGTINANQQANALVINTGAPFTNTGLIESTAAGGLILDATTVTNTGGTISSIGSGAVYLEAGTTINGGTLKGKIYVSDTATFGGPVNNSAGVVTILDSARLTLQNGNYSQLGKVQLASDGDNTDLIIAGTNVTLGGSTLTLSNSLLNRIYGVSASNTLTNQGIIQGAGQIGVGQLTLVNSGTINANQSAGMTIDASPSFANNGTLAVSAGDSMRVTGGTFSNFNSGTLRAGTYNVAGTLEIDQLGGTGGEIVHNAATVVLNGAGSSVIDGGGLDALAKLATNSPAGSFSLTDGRNFNTAGNFSNVGSLAIGIGSTFTVGGPGVFTQTAGTTTDNGTLAATGGIRLTGGTLFGIGDVSGNLQSSGVITPGKTAATTGILTTSGTYTQAAAGSLDISIGGKTAGTKYDGLDASTAVLGGSLNINLINGFVPTVGSTFKIVNFNASSGQFATVNGLAINSTEHFALSYQSTDVMLSVVSGASTAAMTSFTHIPRISEMDPRSALLTRVSGFRSTAPINSDAKPFNFTLPTRAKNEALFSEGTSQSARIAAFQRSPLENRSMMTNQTMASPSAHIAQTSLGIAFSGAMSGLSAASASGSSVASKLAGNIPIHSLGVHARSIPKMSSGSLMISTSGLFSKPHVFYAVN